MAGYHKADIPKGDLGSFSKIQEEFLGMKDALDQGILFMALHEASDLVGAIEAFLMRHGFTLDDALKMKDATVRAFQSGHRRSA